MYTVPNILKIIILLSTIVLISIFLYYPAIQVPGPTVTLLITPNETTTTTVATTTTTEAARASNETSINLEDEFTKQIKFIYKSEKEPEIVNETIIRISLKDEPEFAINSKRSCPIEEWNNVTTNSIPNEELHKDWMSRKIGFQYLYNTAPGVLAAFAYKDHIVVTLTAETFYGKKVYCRYYDCRRREIPNQFESYVFPEATVFCARRPGAEYISISETLEKKAEYSVPIVPRINVKHFFTVCMATLYGSEPKFLQIADFIEYYKLQGATFFQIYLRNVSDYDRMLLDDYVRTGEVEIIKMHDHFWREDFMWHHVQINDCHHRNKHFAKWTAVIDVDERIEMKGEIKTVGEYLDTITDPNIANLVFRVQWVQKTEFSPARYVDDAQLTNEMLFRKFTNTSQIGTIEMQPKCIIRPEKVGVMDIHNPQVMYQGIRNTYVESNVGIVRHYRNVSPGSLGRRNVDRMNSHGPFMETHIAPWIEEKLTREILDRVNHVYNIKEASCGEKQYVLWLHGLEAPCWRELVDQQKVQLFDFKQFKPAS
ncbi:unnamed protein product [Caenorhabditis bovis]|uniref:Glycosyltransferase family 92 protein n=1 Tax=Caenorhabditis bovis TaxID=2654633 RepID=A0A8S1EGN2_9PELO|nr:unnamed protein product [Caenorhabditis bovis]